MFRFNARKSFIFFVAVLLLLISSGSYVLNGLVKPVFAAPNLQINYQGKLNDSGGATVADGTYNIRFFLYTQATGGSNIWTETASTTITSGLFSHMLGTSTSLASVNFNQTLYLGVEIGGTGSPTWDGEMTPRKILGTVPAAFEATQLDGLATTSFLRSDQADSASSLITFLGGVTTTDAVISGTATTTDLFITNDATITGTVSSTNQIISNNLTLAAHTGGILVTNNTGAVSASTSIGDAFIDDDLTLGSGTTFAADIITPDAIRSTGQVDEYCLTYETGDTFEWADCATASGNLFSQQASTTYLTAQQDRLAIGTTSAQALITSSADGLSQTWVQVGNSLSLGNGNSPALAALSPNRVAYYDYESDALRVYEFDGSSWSQVGNGLTISSTAGHHSLTALSPNRVAYADSSNDVLRVYEFDGNSWSQVGSELDLTGIAAPAITTLSNNRIAFIDWLNDELRTYEFDGSTWSQVGSSLTITGTAFATLTTLSPNRIAFFDSGAEDLRVYEFDGNSWSQVGNDLNTGSVAGKPAITALGPNRIAYVDGDNDELRTYEFDGTNWSQVGTGLGDVISNLALAALSPNRVAFVDSNNEELRTYQFAAPLLAAVDSNDMPLFSVSDTGVLTIAGSVATTTSGAINFGSQRWLTFTNGYETNNDNTASLQAAFNTESVFLDRVGVGTTSPRAALDVAGDFRVGTGTDPALFVDVSSGKIGFGTTSIAGNMTLYDQNANTEFHIINDGTSGSNKWPALWISNFNSGGIGGGPAINFRGSRGTMSSPAAVQAGDALLHLQAFGQYGSGYGDAANIRVNAHADFTPTSRPGYIQFSTTASGTNSGAERARLTHIGYFGIGTSSPYAKLSVAGHVVGQYFTATSSATSTIPTLSVTGALYDNDGDAGTNGFILQSTGSGIDWVATSTLGLTGSSIADDSLDWAQFSDTMTLDATTTIAMDHALNFDSGTLYIDGQNNGVGIGIANVGTVANNYPLRVSNGAIKTVTTKAYSAFFGTQENNNPIGFSIETFGGATIDDRYAIINAEESFIGAIDLILQENGGNVGIGTTSPASLLDVYGDFRVGTSGTPTLFVDASTNRVGIGTSSLSNTLTIGGGDYTLSFAGRSAQNAPTTLTQDTSDNFTINTNLGVGKTISLGTPTNSRQLRLASAGAILQTGIGGLSIGTNANPNYALDVRGLSGTADIADFASSTGDSVLRITAAGTVGIGTTTAQALLTTSVDGLAQTWAQVGGVLSLGTASLPAVAALSPNRVAYVDQFNDDLRTYEFNGSSWSQIGSDLNISGASNPSLTALSPNRVAFIDNGNDDLRVYEFDGNSWSQVGNELNIVNADVPNLTALSANRIAFLDADGDELRVYEFDGTDWSQVGNALSLSVAQVSLTALSPNRIAFYGRSSDDLRVYEFDGDTWSQVGNDLNISSTAFYMSVTTLSPNRIAFIEGDSDDLRVYEFDGTNWSQVGTDLNINGVFKPAITALSPNRIALVDDGNSELHVYQFAAPLLAAVDGNDMPLFSVSDTGVVTIAGSVATTTAGAINFGSQRWLTFTNAYETSGDNTASLQAAFNTKSIFSDRVGIGVSTIPTNASNTSLALSGGALYQTQSNPVVVGTTQPGGTDGDLDNAFGTYVSGDYAYVAAFNNDSLNVIDINDPTNPTQVGVLQDTTNLNGAQAVHVAGRYAYVAAAVNDSLQVIDISDPTNPVRVGGYHNRTDLNGANSVYVSGKYAYVTAFTNNSLEIIDISDPTTPVRVGGIKDDTNLGGANNVTVAGRYAYVAAFANDSLQVIDISDPTDPIRVGGVQPGGSNGDLNGASQVRVSGAYAYVTASNDDSFNVIDISSSTAPTQVGYLQPDGANGKLDGAGGLYMAGRYAYVGAGGSDSIAVIDISSSTNPLHVAEVTSSTTLASASSIMAVGRYLYVAAGDYDSFTVVDIGGVDTPALTTGVLAADTVDVRSNLNIANDGYIGGALGVGESALISGQLAVTGNASTTVTDNLAQLLVGAGNIRDSFMSFVGRTSTTSADTWSLGLDVTDNSFRIASSTELGTNDYFTVSAAGNVGIGSTSPYATLSVAGDLALTGALYDSTNSAGTAGFILQSTGTSTEWVATSTLGLTGSSIADDSLDWAQFSDSMTLDATTTIAMDHALNFDSGTLYIDGQNNRIGIGTTSPTYMLDLYGDNGTGQTQIQLTNPDTSSNGFSGLILQESTAAGQVGRISYLNSGRSSNGINDPSQLALYTLSGATGGIAMYTLADAPIVFATNGFSRNEEHLRIDGGGQIGIGTTSPWARLSVVQHSGATGPLFAVASSSAGTATSTEFIINEYGQVGIGTTSPYQELSVNGDFALTGALYDGNASPGTSGMVLQTTGAGTQWVSTSSLNISGVSSDSNVATYIVAATSSVGSSTADYIADGTNDEATIQAAIDALPATGGIVYLLEGYYGIEGQIDIDKYGVVLQGSGPGTVLRVVTNTNSTFDVIDHLSGAGNSTIRDLTIDGNKAGQSSGTMYGIRYSADGATSTIYNVTITQMRDDSIYVDSSFHNVTIDSVTISNNNDTGDYGIYVDGTNVTGLTISNSHFSHVDDGINTNTTNGEQIKIVDNHFYEPATNGVNISRGQYVLVANNTFDGNDVNNGSMISVGSNASDVSILDNVVNGSNRDSIGIGAVRVTVSGNTIHNTGNGTLADAIDISSSAQYIVVSDNLISTTTAADGINVDGDYVTITGNIIENTDVNGIGVNGGENIVIANNIIKNTGVRGIYLAFVDNFTINDNMLIDIGANGIELDDGVSGTVSGNTIDEVGPGDAGIDIDEANDIVVSGNAISDAGGSVEGIEISNDSYRIHLDGNVITGTWTYFIDDNSPATTYAQNNRGNIIADPADFDGGAYTAFSVTQLGTGNLLDLVDADGTSTSTVFTVEDGGFVGIGTSSPQALLTVSAAATGLSQTWSQIGNDTTISNVNEYALAALSPNRVAYIDVANDDLRTYEFNGHTWSQVGTDLNISGVTDPALAGLSPNRIAFIDESTADLRVYEFDGNAWSQVGTDLNISGSTDPALTALSPNRVAYIGDNDDNLRVYEFDGTNWTQVGSDTNISSVENPTIASLSPNRIAFIDQTNDDLRTYEFNGITWSQIGSDLVISTTDPAIAALTPDRIAFYNATGNDLSTYEFDGTSWSLLGSALTVTNSEPSVTALTPNRVALIDPFNDDLRTYQFSAPLLAAVDSNDMPLFSVSDTGVMTFGGAVSTSTAGAINFGSNRWITLTNAYETNSANTASLQAAFNTESVFLDLVGIGTTSPAYDLSIDGDLLLTGALYDSTNASGTNGMVLQTTGSGVNWVATSSLGIAGADTNSDTATFIVAATSSLGASDADYIADGTNDEATIQAAIDALPSTGGVVQLLEGYYAIEAQIDIDREGVTLQGVGANTVLRIPTTTDSTFDVIDHLAGAGNTVIRDLAIDGNKVGQSSGINHGIRYTADGATSTIYNVSIKNMRDEGIYVDDTYYHILIDSVTITNDGNSADHAVFMDGSNWRDITITNSFFDNVGAAVYISGTGGKELKIVNNNFSRMSRSGVELEGSSPQVTDVVIADNVFDPQGLNLGDLIQAAGGVDRVTIANNVIKESGNSAISLGSSNSSVVGNVIEVIDHGSADAVEVLAAAQNILIADNSIGSTTGSGDGIEIDGDYVTFIGNTIDAPGGDGIDIDGDYIVVSNNIIKDAGIVGIIAGGSEETVITSNIISNSNSRGIYLSSIDNFVVNDNTVINSGSNGIELDSGLSGTVNDNRIDEVGTSDIGIDLVGAEDIVISGNAIHDVSGSADGIQISNTSLRIHLDGNVITGAGWTNKIDDNSSASTYLANNRIDVLAGADDFQDGAYTAFSITQLGTGNILDLFDASGTATTSVFTVVDGGNVGIGTTSPSAKLAIHQIDGSGPLFTIASSSNGTATTTLLTVGRLGTTTAANGFNITNGCFAVNGTCISTGGSSVTFGTDNQIPFTNSGGTDFDYSSDFTFDGSLLSVVGSSTFGSGFTAASVNASNTINLLIGQNADGASNGISFFEDNDGFGMKLGFDGTGIGDDNALHIYGTDDAAVFTFKNGGNFGISSSSPDGYSADFVLSDTDRARMVFTATDATPDVVSFIDSRGGGADRMQIGTVSDHDITFFTGSSAFMNLDHDNGGLYLGGTGDADALLHVIPDDSGVEVVVGDDIYSADDAVVRLNMGNNNGDSYMRVGQSSLRYMAVGWSYDFGQVDAYGHISTVNASNPLALQTAGGSVGIGTTTPLVTLHVEGDAMFGDAFNDAGSNNASNVLNLNIGSNANGGQNGISFFENNGGFGMKLGYDGTGSGAANALRIYNGNDSALVTFQNGGNVGIGTSTDLNAQLTIQSSTTDNILDLIEIDGATVFSVSESGNVGIGTSTPIYSLEVISANATRGLSVENSASAAQSIYGYHSGSGAGIGVYGQTIGNGSSIGVLGEASTGIGVYGSSNTGISGYFISSDGGNTQPTLLVQRAGAATADLLAIHDNSGTELALFSSVGYLGLGSTTPSVRLTVGSSTSSAIPVPERYRSVAIAGALELDGAFYDTTNSAGTANYVLRSTGTSTEWVSGSDLGISLFTDAGTTTYLTATTDRLAVGTTSAQALLTTSAAGLTQTWSQVGTDLNLSGTIDMTIVALSPNRIAEFDLTDRDLRVYEFNGTSWSQVGTDFNISPSGRAAMTALSPNRIAFHDATDSDLRVYEFDGNTWSQVGTDFNIPSSATAISALSSNRIAFVGTTGLFMRTYEFDGSSWTQIGTSTAIGGAASPGIAMDTLAPNRVAFMDGNNDDLRTYEFDGYQWSQIGNDLNFLVTTPRLTTLSPNRIAFFNDVGGGDNLHVYEFDGNDWSEIGTMLNISNTDDVTMAALSPNRIAFFDDQARDLRVYQFSAPLLAAVDGNDMPLFSVSDTGVVTIAGPVATSTAGAINFGSQRWLSFTNNYETNVDDTASLQAAFHHESIFLDRVGIGTTTPSTTLHVDGLFYASATSGTSTFEHNLLVKGTLKVGTSSVIITENGLEGTNNFSVEANNFGVGTSSPNASLDLWGSGMDDILRISSSTGSRFLTVDYQGNLGIGTSSPAALLHIHGDASNVRISHQTNTSFSGYAIYEGSTLLGTLTGVGSNFATAARRNDLEIDSRNAGDVTLQTLGTGNVGIGVTDPDKLLEVFETVADDQFRISYDATRYADFQVDSVGDLIVDAQGGDIRFNDENLWICAGGSCPSGTPSGNGNLLVEERVGVGTSSPREALEVYDNIRVAGGGSPAVGTATSTFEGDVLILGKLDVATIDPIYTIDNTKYATYGMSSIGIKEEAMATMILEEYNEESGYYEHEIAWSELEEGSDLWLFYQITEFGEAWEELVISLTPTFAGDVFYTENLQANTITIHSTEPGKISARFSASRFDTEDWPNLRPDQHSSTTHFILPLRE